MRFVAPESPSLPLAPLGFLRPLHSLRPRDLSGRPKRRSSERQSSPHPLQRPCTELCVLQRASLRVCLGVFQGLWIPGTLHKIHRSPSDNQGPHASPNTTHTTHTHNLNQNGHTHTQTITKCHAPSQTNTPRETTTSHFEPQRHRKRWRTVQRSSKICMFWEKTVASDGRREASKARRSRR